MGLGDHNAPGLCLGNIFPCFVVELLGSTTTLPNDHPCPKCGSGNVRLRKRHKLEDDHSLLQKARLWHCRACGNKFRTIEVYEDPSAVHAEEE